MGWKETVSNDNILLLAVWTVWAVLVYGCMFRRIWVDVSFVQRGRINFFITDFWAATLGLVPSFALIAYFIRLEGGYPILNWIIAINTVICQLAGMIWFRYSSEGRANDKFVPRFSQAVLVLVGALAGLLANIVCLIVTGLATAIIVSSPIPSLVAIVIFFYARWLTKEPE